MLENQLLNDLDEDLMFELDDVVRANQLNCLPFAKSGRAELLLHEQYPELAEDILEERQRRIRDTTFRSSLQVEETRSSSYRARIGSVDDSLSASPSQEKARRKSKGIGPSRNAPFSPNLRPKNSTVDLMFDMDEDAPSQFQSASSPTLETYMPDQLKAHRLSPEVEDTLVSREENSSFLQQTPDFALARTPDRPNSAVKTWSSPALDSAKLDMRAIMSQASSSRTSALSMSISAQKSQQLGPKANIPKVSQKERKKQQAQQAASSPAITLEKADSKPASPWQVAARGPKMSLKDVLEAPSALSPSPLKTLGSPLQSNSSTPRRTASPDTRFAGQRRAVSGTNSNSQKSTLQRMASPDVKAIGPRRTVSGTSVASSTPPPTSRSQPVMPHSKSYNASASRAEPTLQLSMSDIIGQQQRELEVIKEAVAKRSLQEIQEEQAFQEWWDAESRRAQEEEAARARPAVASAVTKSGKGYTGATRGKSGRGRGRGRGEGGQSRGREKGPEKVAGG